VYGFRDCKLLFLPAEVFGFNVVTRSHDKTAFPLHSFTLSS